MIRLQRIGLPHSEIRGSFGYLHLTPAFRSLSRPSSPPRAQASAVCPYLLVFFRFAVDRQLILRALRALRALMPLRDNQTSKNNIFSVALLVLAFYQYVKDR